MPSEDKMKTLTAFEAIGRVKGEFLGKSLMAREICDFANPHWPNQRIKATATALAESHGRVGAYNYNVDEWNNIISEDCGLFQINIPNPDMDHSLEDMLRTESKDPLIWTPVVKYNVKYAYSKWATKGTWRDGKLDYNRWRPWVAYTSGWATYPRLYAWHHDADRNPVGPWVKSGRYLHNAIRGVANWHLLMAQDMNSVEALEFAKHQASYFGITEAECNWRYSTSNAVYYVAGPAPTEPPTADTNFGYPIKNDGR